MKKNALILFTLGLLGMLLISGIETYPAGKHSRSGFKKSGVKRLSPKIYQWKGWTFILAAKNSASETEEMETLRILKGLLKKYNLSPWVRVRKVHIEHGAASRSRPFTITTRKNRDPEALLATFVHEQIHNVEKEFPRRFRGAMRAVEALFPHLDPDVAGDRRAAYLHFIVNYFEIKAMTRLLGRGRGLAVISRKDKNVSIYRKIRTNIEKFRKIYVKYQLEGIYR